MCVIMITESTRPPEDMIEGAFKANPEGAGIAWREGGLVHWAKGLNLEEIQVACAEKPLPYVAHFRIPTAGGNTRLLNHPFCVNDEATMDLNGTSDGGVLFHNGHWGDWKHTMRDVALKSGVKIPLGKWSDSRAMAWCASILGLGFLDIIDEKVAVLGPGENDLEVFGSWIFAEKEKIWVSNKNYEHRRPTQNWRGTSKEADSSTSNPTHQAGHNDYFTRLPASLDRDHTTSGTVTEMGSGGAPPESPFAPVIREWREKDTLFKAGNLSKSQWKRARKIYDKEMMRLGEVERQRFQSIRQAEMDRVVTNALANLDQPTVVH